MASILNNASKIVDSYINCWSKCSKSDSSLYESNNLGCENLQLFRNQLDISTFRHEDVCNLSWLLTRELKAQINRDHFMFWTWCHFVVKFFEMKRNFSKAVSSIFGDGDLINCFDCVIAVVLFRQNNIPINTKNYFIDKIYQDRYLILGPIVFSLLEGLLRRINFQYVDTNGKVVRPFTITGKNDTLSRYDLKSKATKGSKTEVNQIPHLFYIFEQLTVPNLRKRRSCVGLKEFKVEVQDLLSRDFYRFIGEDRNTLLHGAKYWTNKIPIVMNLLCLLFIDAISPVDYDNNLDEFNKHLKSLSEMNNKLLGLGIGDTDLLLSHGIYYPPRIDI